MSAPSSLDPTPHHAGGISAAEQLRVSAEGVHNIEPLAPGDHACEAHLVTFDDQTQAVYKPAVGEFPFHRRAFPPGTTAIREVAASRLDAFLGFGLIPTTIVWYGPRGTGSLQRFISPTDDGLAVGEYPRIDEERMAILDYLIANSDRHGLNYLTNDTGNIVAINHGFTFPVTSDSPMRSSFVTDYFEQPLSAHVIDELRSVRIDDVADMLRSIGLEDAAIDAVTRRLHEVQATGRIMGDAWPGKIGNEYGFTMKERDR